MPDMTAQENLDAARRLLATAQDHLRTAFHQATDEDAKDALATAADTLDDAERWMNAAEMDM